MDVSILKPGDIVVTSFDPTSWTSKVVAWFGGSRWTHIFIVKDQTTLLESGFPKGAKNDSLPDRFISLDSKGQEFKVLRVYQLTEEELQKTIETADSWLGRKYDVLQAIIFGLFHFFINDGPKRVICSRYVSGAFMAGGRNLFPEQLLAVRAGINHPRYKQILKGWTVPKDFILFSDTFYVSYGDSLPKKGG